jgi:hypothetical protein
MDEPGPKADPVHESSAPPADELPKASLVLAVAVETPAEREDATKILGGRAQVLEETEGTLQDGDCINFDPLGSSARGAEEEANHGHRLTAIRDRFYCGGYRVAVK